MTRPSVPLPPADTLDRLGLAPAGARIVRFFLLRPGASLRARELQRVLGLGGASIQRELSRLLELGALERVEEPDGRVLYRAREASSIWKGLRMLAATSTDPGPLMRDALVDLRGITAAFVHGSCARGTQRADSDVDLLVVEGSNADRSALLERLSEAALLMGREVNAIRYSPVELGERLGDPDHPGHAFLRRVLAEPKRWLLGSPDTLLPLALAVGIQRDEWKEGIVPA
jgi:predicted nucleotidyltransferase